MPWYRVMNTIGLYHSSLLGHGNENDTPLEISRAEVRQAIIDIKTHKAPGYDNIPGTAIKNSVNLVEGIFTELARNCAEVGYFPDDWKVGNLVHIPKGPDKDPHSLKSYRPLTMLCEFSKVLERIIKTKIHELASSPISPANQFGFVSGSSTIHSMLELSRIIDYASDKYVMVIFIDIKGAFDNVRWHRVIERMVEINLPAKLISLVASYFSNRTIVLEAERHKIQKQATRGCPQGSILGPEFWNLVVADLLMIPLPVGVNLLAYADDVAVTIEGNTRVELERKAATVTSELERWMELNQLSVSIEKCQYVMFKGDFHKWTSPRMIIGGQRLKRVSQVKYLGVTWDEKRTFRAHVANVTADAIRNFTSLRRFFYSNWGDRPPALTKIYRGAIVPKVTYAAAIWDHTIQDRQVKSKLLTCQRYCTIAISASAATVSHAATQVIAGEPPLHMVNIQTKEELVKEMGSFSYGKRHNDGLENIGQTEAKRFSNSQQQLTANAPRITCHYCRRPGHRMADCRVKKYEESTNLHRHDIGRRTNFGDKPSVNEEKPRFGVWYRCQSRDHYANSCPQRP
ncbi:hypothetical protein M8J75_011670 [Diaphorina citri]|nr:hypothetical protein M8J75_011670 [Diaphorina citri]